MMVMEPYGSLLGETDHKLTHEEIDAELMRGSGWAVPQPVAMMRADAVRKVGGYRKEYLWSEDLDLFLRLAEVGRMANLPDVLVRYRTHPGSTNHRLPHVQLERTRQCIIETYQRRGLPVPTDLQLMSPFQNRRVDKYVAWAWAALRDRNVKGAREHAARALRERPFAVEPWKAAYCALRGH